LKNEGEISNHVAPTHEGDQLTSVPEVDSSSGSAIRSPRHASFVRSEKILHVLFLGISLAILAMSFLMSSDGKTQVFLPGFSSPMPSACATKVIFGVDCPGCGLTRAFISISHGEFLKAWNFNRASFIVYAFVAVQIPWHSIQLWRYFHDKRPMETFLIYLAPLVLVAVLFVNWVLKLSSLFQ
jgi:hypothetical protein